MSVENVEKLITDHRVEFIDLRFADMRGVQHHVTYPKSIIEPGLFEDGKMFDGSSISGWRGIQNSDMVLLPDPATAFLDPFTADPTLVLTCDILHQDALYRLQADLVSLMADVANVAGPDASQRLLARFPTVFERA